MSESEDLIRLRRRLLDLHQTGVLHPEAFGTYQQTVLQVYREAQNKRTACMAQAEVLRKQADDLVSKAHAYGTMGSMLYAVINGFVEIEHKRVAEEQTRKAAEEGDLPTHSASGEEYEKPEPEPKTKRSRKKKSG